MNNKGFGIPKKLVVITLFGTMLLCGGKALAQTPSTPHVTVGGSVFGGGNLASVSGNSSVIVDQADAVVTGDVYGGGALADVGTDNSNTTTVDILDGNVGGDVYGGGLGRKAADAVPAHGDPGDDDYTPAVPAVTPIAAAVNGVVTVNIGALGSVDGGYASSVSGEATIGGSVFGGNNANGTPKDNVTVNIYKTARTSAQETSGSGYALSQVFGGGNQAHYEPATTGKLATVHVWTCDNTIQYVYGGGNAANVGTAAINSGTNVIIDGGRIEWVFGGGNGAGVGNPGANVYGSTTVTFHAGEITYIFGGSNEKGDVTVSKNVDILADNSNCSTKHIASLYGGSNQAITNGSIEITMGCNSSINNCQIDTLFGGSRKANVTQNVTLNINGGTYDYVFAGNNVDDTIKGNVTLNLHGGTIREAAFGGNNGGGAILGNITVNVADTSKGCPLNVKDIFGAGNLAKYTAPTGGGARANNPIVYVNRMRKDASITGNVYGAGNGDMDSIENQRPGMVTGNPLVVIGDDVATDTATIAGNVYGGGNAAKVVGNTKVIMQNALSSVDTIFGGGNLAEVTGSTTDSIYAGTVSGDVYGGGALANTGSTTVVLSSGTVNGSLYGGGLGDGSHAAMVNGTATVVVNGGKVDGAVFGCNNVSGSPTGAVSVTINGSDPHDDVSDPAVYAIKGVYGGGNLAAYTSTNDLVDSTTVTINGCATSVQDVFGGGNAAPVPAAKVIVYGGIINRVFAGGNGESGTPAHVGYNSTLTDVTSAPQYGTGNASVHIVSGTIQQVFGGANSSGRIRNHSLIDINKTAGAQCEMDINQVFGGGNLADGKAATINVGCTGVYADGEGITQLFGGANQADVDGDILLNITGGNIDAVFGGNNRSGSISGTITVNVEITNTSCDDHISNVFGGGMMAAYTGDPVVNIKHGTIYGSVFGAGYGDESDATHEIGKVTGNPQVSIGDATPAHQVTINGSVFGGGQSGNVAGTPVVHVLNKCNTTISDNVYGGCQAAEVTGTSVTIDGGNITGSVFGGGEGESMAAVAANVNGNVAVTVTGGTIDKVFGGCNSMGDVSGTITMNINKGATSCEMHIGEVYGGGNEAAGHAGTINIGCTGDYSTYGEKIGNVYGGAKAANVTNNITLNINGGYIDTVFGGNNVSGNIAGITTVNVNWDDELSCDNNYLGTLFGGGNLASMTGSATVNMQHGIVTHKLFGGGNEAGTGASTVDMTGGTVLEGFYGGNNTSGTVTGNIAVNITGGTVGANGSPVSVYGGGLGNSTRTNGDVEVTIDGGTIWGDVYGGSGFGNVGNDINDAVVVNILNGEVKGSVFGGGLGSTSPAYAATEAGSVTVNIGSGTPASVEGGASSVAGGATIGGSVYGCNNTNGSPNGDVTVNIFQTAHTSGNAFVDAGYAITNVFGGGKNADYTATGKKATVNVYTCDNTIGTLFGGGDAAAVPGTEVNIYGGRIGTVFGGGNGAVTAANVNGNINLNLHGGTIGTLVSASNQRGTISGTINVNVDNVNGCNEKVEDFFGGANQVDIAGSVNATIECGAGTFRNVYGGSNKANIGGDVNFTIKGGTITNAFGGSKGVIDDPATPAIDESVNASIGGNVTLNLYGGTITNAFGGSDQNGTIGGDITVNVLDYETTNCGLEVTNVYGAGNLTAYTGSPTVNVMHGTVSGNVYGAGKGSTAVVTGNPQVNIGYVDGMASLVPSTHKYKATTTNLTAVVNDSVFGGGDEAAVTGSPIVTLDKTNSQVGNLYGGGNEAGITGSTTVTMNNGRVTDGIYGGCNTSGDVTGNSTINLLGGQIGSSSNTAVVFGGGYGAATNIAGNVLVTMGNIGGTANPTIYADIYGGSALGNVNTGNVDNDTKVNSTNTTTLDILSGTLTGNIFGGGLGQREPSAIAPMVHGMVHINIGRNTGTNQSPVYTGYANLVDAKVYGCNNVNGSPQNDVHIDVYATAHPTNTLVDDTITRSYAIDAIYGGGNKADYAPENNNHSSAKKTYIRVYGCENTVDEIYGGGNAAAVVGDSVYIEGGRFNMIFGGGNGAVTAANVGLGGIHLNARSGRVGYIFEQCNKRGEVTPGAPIVYYQGGGDCNNGILRVDYHYCGGNIQDVYGDSLYIFTCTDNVRYLELYGGCRLGCHYGNITLEIQGGTIGDVYGGSMGQEGYSADVRKYPDTNDVKGHELDYPEGILTFLRDNPELQGTGGNVTLIIKGGTIGRVFGGCNTNGNVEGRITVIIDSAEINACPLDLDYVYGGGNEARYIPDTTHPYPYPLIQLKKGHVNHDVFGGGHGLATNVDAGRVESNPHIVMAPEDGKFWVKGNIYGGGEMGSVGKYTREESGKPTACVANTGNTKIEISAGRVGPSTLTMPIFKGHVFGGSKGTVGDTSTTTGNPKISHLAYVNTSDVTISGTAFIKGSVYGGGESGRVLHDTYVKIQGGQIGCGEGQTGPYNNDQFIDPHTTPVTNGNALAECNHWDYGDGNTPKKYDPYDPYEHTTAYDGHTFYGNVFGGGSGMMPYKSRNKANTADSSIYIKTSGRVCGKTKVEVTGGHILTSLYGGCEMGDVTGDSCVVIFSGGTLGVPRTLAQIEAHPVTCYLFGAGKGDERVRFNTCTNVENVRVTVNGGIIYGSVLGGGEDGHVMKNAKVEIKPGAKIGTWGTSYVDGNVFGGGRGFSGNALTAGNVGGDVLVNITGGTMLGSIYGGGRLASVGCGLYPDTDPRYGVMRPDNEDDAGNTVAGFSRGHITVNIGGNAVIGNDVASDYSLPHSRGGNVFGGSMGRLTKLDGTMVLPLWHRLGCAKATTVNIRDNVHVKGNVYGGSELGRVTDSITVNISGNVTVGRNAAGSYGHGNVYGGGMGHTLTDVEVGQISNADTKDSIPTFAGLTGGTIKVNISGGAINNNVYGAGELASVGTITTVTKHTDKGTTYFLSWPYKYTYNGNSGDARVKITGGTIGFINGSDTTGGNIYGSARGTVGDRYVTGRLATARVTHVDINLTNPGDKIIGDVYGSGENGHVYDSAVVTLTNGLVLGNVFGGGKGVDTYTDQLKDPTDDHLYNAEVYDIIAGKVFGNTKVNILGGRVAKNVYGGGNLASVGIGNYKGYGEATGTISSADSSLAEDWGHCYVNILGGIIGPEGLTYGTSDNSDYAVTTGHVYGAGKGIVFPAAAHVGFDYDRNYYMAYVNKTTVVIGDSTQCSCAPTVLYPHVTGIVFGGGENGHVRFDTYVQTNRGQIGVRPLTSITSDVGHWANRGNIFGAGRGEDVNLDGSYCQSAGSVTRNTTIDVLGARIYRNVQGGGAMASVGPIKGRTGDSSTCVINVRLPLDSDTLGGTPQSDKAFGGYVGGGSRGIPSPDGYDNSALATCHNSQINIYKGWIKNTIYGGGENGQMLGNTQVNVYDGYVRSAIYGGGKGSWKETGYNDGHTYLNDTLSGYVAGNTEVNLLGGIVPYTYGGCRRANVGGNATINIGMVNPDYDSEDPTSEPYIGNVSFDASKRKVYGGNQYAGSPKGNIYVNVYKTAHTTTDAASYTEDDGHGAPTYAISHLYGGSYNSPYLPSKAGRSAQVHIYTCDNTIGEVYGGCSAADAGAKPGIGASTKLIIDGGRFGKVFGGGDGTLDAYIGTPVPANIYGAAVTEIHGGTIGSLFGGSNSMGQADTIRISVDNESDCGTTEGDEFFGGSNLSNLGPTVLSTTLGCGVKFRAAYGGSNQADIIGNVTFTIEGGEFEEVYAGSKGAIVSPSARQGQKDTAEANIAGNTHLIIHGGKIHSAFGGSNINGNITGTITVDIDSTYNTTECPWNVDYVYGGSNLTQYLPDDSTVTNHSPSPLVNILCGTVNNDVYGGGKGSSTDNTAGLVQSNPSVVMSQTAKGHTWVKGSIYGGGELATAEGTTSVTVTGGTVGQQSYYFGSALTTDPDADPDADADYTTDVADYYKNNDPDNTGLGHVYGGGKGLAGDNAFCDVNATNVIIGTASGAASDLRIYGSVYGGSAMGHVTGNTAVTVHSGTIGTVGVSSWDGNIFGGGEGGGYVEDENSNGEVDDDEVNFIIYPTSGRVGGNTSVTIDGGRVKGSVYGGGRLALTGVDATGDYSSFVTSSLYDSTLHGFSTVSVGGNAVIGMGANDNEAKTALASDFSVGDIFGSGRGDVAYYNDVLAGRVANTTVSVSGSPTVYGAVFGGGEMAGVGYWTEATGHPFVEQTGTSHVSVAGGDFGTPYEYTQGYLDDPGDWTVVVDGKLTHACTGNIVGASQGDVDPESPHWISMGRSRQSYVTVSGGTIMGNVYGGAEQGVVLGNTDVRVSGCTIGTRIVNPNSGTAKETYAAAYAAWRSGDSTTWAGQHATWETQHATWETDHATWVENGEVGDEPIEPIEPTKPASPDPGDTNVYLYSFGSVFGGGYGREVTDRHINDSCLYTINGNDTTWTKLVEATQIAGRTYGNTKVTISGGTIRENVYGGGNMASVGYVREDANHKYNLIDSTKRQTYDDGTGHYVETNGICTVTISGGIIGPSDHTQMNGHVYGGGKGVGNDPTEYFKNYCNVHETHLTVSGGHIYGSTFGGGADCHVLGHTHTTIHRGAYIGSGEDTEEYDGCVFGGGRNAQNSNATAGRVQGNTRITVDGGRIRRSILGGGALARTGVDTNGRVDAFLTGNDANGVPIYDSAYHGNTNIYVTAGAPVVLNSVLKDGKDYDGNTVTVAGMTDEQKIRNKNFIYALSAADSITYKDYLGTTEVRDDGKIVVYTTAIGAYDGPVLVDNDYTIGDIFGGGKGDTKDTVDILAGRVMNTYVRVDGYPRIMADIYAGGEMSSVGWWDTNLYQFKDDGTYEYSPSRPKNPLHDKYYGGTGYTHLVIGGEPYTGTPYEFSSSCIHYGRPWTLIDSLGRLYHTCSGNVYGGGQGYVEQDGTHYWNWVHMGRVRHTEVTVNGGRFMGNAFGGGARGVVKEDCHVTVTGGCFGNIIYDQPVGFPKDHYYYGSVFGGGYGNHKRFSHISDSSFVITEGVNVGQKVPMVPTEQAGRVYGNTYVKITGGQIMDCVYGGGDMASTGWVERNPATGAYILDDPDKRHGGVCNVDISGSAIVGPLDYNGHNAYVYAAGRGIGSDAIEYSKTFCNVNEAHLTVHLTTTGDATIKPNAWNPSSHGGRIWGSLFGGGADSHVLDSVSVVVHSGLVGTQGTTSYDGNIFGGGRNYLNTNHTNGRVQGNIRVFVDGGTLQGTIFGGGRLALSGVDVDGHFIDSTHGNVNILVRGNATIGNSNADSLLKSNESCGDIFGSGKGDIKNYEDVWAGRVTNAKITVKDSTTGSPRIYGSIFGGGEMASLGYWDDTIKDAEGNVIFHTKDDVTGSYGTAYGTFYDGTGTAVVNISGNVLVGTSLEYTVAPYANPGDWTIYESTATDTTLLHTCTGNVFGGSQGDVDPSAPRWVSMGRSASAVVNISGGRFMSNIFGGGEQGIVTGDTRVNISGGVFGIDALTGSDAVTANANLTKYYSGDIYAAGYGCDDPDEYNDVTPNDSTVGSTALSVGWNPGLLSGRTFGNSRVDITGGHIAGSVYGGGSFASVGDDKPGFTVNGNTTVNIGLPGADPDDKSQATGSATIDGEVFGANNFSGTPYGNTEVHIYKTAHNAANTAPTAEATKALTAPVDELTGEDVEAIDTTGAFALSAVYGGGNKASHTPVANDGTTLVHVHYCEENTIKQVYGGGNAASTKNNHIIIDGGRIYEVFGGGNGYSATGNHSDPAAANYNPGANVVGTGDAVHANGTAWTQIHGGLITDVFGGSNSKGNIGQTILDIEKEGDCDMMVANTYGGGNESEGGGGVINLHCGTHAGNFYGGSRKANLVGDVVLNIYGGTYENVFGGSKGTADNPANIDGNVTINFYGGNVQRLFGGSDVNGNITGLITVNVDIDPDYDCDDGLRLDTVYGGGRDAAYTPMDPFRGSPTVNIMNNRYKPSGDSTFVEIYDVFGGGLGITALCTSYPRVVVGAFGDGSKTLNEGTPEETTVTYTRGVQIFGNLYGGGSAASVTGNTTVVVRDAVVGTTAHAGDPTMATGTVYGGGLGDTARVNGDTYVGIFGKSDIMNNVYGGGSAGIVTGNTYVAVAFQKQILPPDFVAFQDFTDLDGSGNPKIKGRFVNTTPGVRYRYTTMPNSHATNQGIPTPTNGTLWIEGTDDPFEFTLSDTLQFIAYLWDETHNKVDSSMIPSLVGFDKMPAPVVIVSDQNVATFDGTMGATIYYTLDGSTPTTSSTPWGTIFEDENLQDITLTNANQVVKAIAVGRGCFTSEVGYVTADKPTVEHTSNSFTITAKAGERIIYTTDGSTPISLMNQGRRPGETAAGYTNLVETTLVSPEDHTPSSVSSGSTVTYKKRTYTDSEGNDHTYRWAEVTAATDGPTTVTFSVPAGADCTVKAIAERTGYVPSLMSADVYRH